MRAAALDRFGGPAVLKIRDIPVPELGPSEVLIAVHTAGVGSWDADMREGWWPDDNRPPFPLVLGTDGSGTIAAVGSRVRRFAPGDRVYAYSFGNSKGGFYAEYVVVEAEKVGRPPGTLTMMQAGAATVTGLTALQGIELLGVKRGQTVVIHGASGGVGSLALQFAKMRGARVLATASGRDGLALVRRLGADAAADGRRADLKAAAREFAPDGVDAVFATAGGPELTRLLDAVRRGGRLVYPNGVEPAPRKRRGLTVRSYDATAGAREFARLGRAIDAARLKVPIAASYPLAQAARAHQRLAKGHVLGKVALRVRGRR
jgi:NADPH:quinone reductase-like Zn-dependent oxidoreductase